MRCLELGCELWHVLFGCCMVRVQAASFLPTAVVEYGLQFYSAHVSPLAEFGTAVGVHRQFLADNNARAVLVVFCAGLAGPSCVPGLHLLLI